MEHGSTTTEKALAANQMATAPRNAHESMHLLIVDSDAGLAEHLRKEARSHGIQTEVVFSIAAAREALAQTSPHVVLLDPGLSGRHEEGMAFLEECTGAPRPIPVMVMTMRDRLPDRVEVARRGGRGFLHKALAPGQIIENVVRFCAHLHTPEATVLAVDDDPDILALLPSLMKPLRVSLIPLEQPLHFWDILEEVVPDLVILDVNMPGLNGIELCRVLRHAPRWRELPVLFLTASTDTRTLQQVFAAGADDYVTKPILGPELTARLKNRLERSRLLREMAETDALTGLANRRKSVQVLERYLHLARRNEQAVSLAVLDLDHFKRVNDTYGHAAGDEVLRHLGMMLLRSFRSEDIVARWGGEELVLGMYGMPREGGTRRLTEVLETFRQYTFRDTAKTPFHVTFSAGVAEYPRDGATIQTLYQAADKALYHAKSAGRNQVLATRREGGCQHGLNSAAR